MNPDLLKQLKDEYAAAIGRDDVRVQTIVNLVEEANQLPPGDYVEVGVFWGHSLKIIHHAMDPDRTLFGFDTFEGFDQRDLALEFKRTSNPDYTFHPTSVELVRRYLRNPANLCLVKGWFPDTLWVEGCEDIDWRFAHIDVDLGAATANALKVLWPKMLPGACILIHDYGNQGWDAYKAVNNFCAVNSLGPPYALDDYHVSALIRKPK